MRGIERGREDRGCNDDEASVCKLLLESFFGGL